jgi:response regulator RpfG family c-di-GMP phosphodiesterase
MVTHLRSSGFPYTERQAATLDMTVQDQGIVDRQLKPRALEVDDSADIAFMLLTLVQHTGYDTLMAVSAVEALALAQREHFDLVISDIGMPEMDGYDRINKAL